MGVGGGGAWPLIRLASTLQSKQSRSHHLSNISQDLTNFTTAYNALDDLLLETGNCQWMGSTTPAPVTTPAPETKLTCDFENSNPCDWTQDLTDGGDWVLTSGALLSSDQGPLVDHTTHLSEGRGEGRKEFRKKGR